MIFYLRKSYLTETWLDQNGTISLIEACPPPYTFLQKVHCGKKGGGIAAIFMQTLACKEIVFDDFTTFEYLAIEIIESKCLVVIVYRPPKQNSGFISEFFELLTLCVTSYDKILIVGDFNIHVDNKSDRKAVEFVAVLHSFSFTQHVNGPTHNKEHTLDLIISYGVNVNVNEITDLAISDHFCLFFDCKINIPFHPKEK